MIKFMIGGVLMIGIPHSAEMTSAARVALRPAPGFYGLAGSLLLAGSTPALAPKDPLLPGFSPQGGTRAYDFDGTNAIICCDTSRLAG
jgi:hypothetical protein